MGTLIDIGTLDKSFGRGNEEKSSELPADLSAALNELSIDKKTEMGRMMLLVAGTKIIKNLSDAKTSIERLTVALEVLPNTGIDVEAIKKSAEFVKASLLKFISSVVPAEDMPHD